MWPVKSPGFFRTKNRGEDSISSNGYAHCIDDFYVKDYLKHKKPKRFRLSNSTAMPWIRIINYYAKIKKSRMFEKIEKQGFFVVVFQAKKIV